MTPDTRGEHLLKIQQAVSQAGLVQQGLPIYYPAAFSNMARVFSYAPDFSTAVFNDFLYAANSGEINEDFLPTADLSKYNGQTLSTKQQGILSKGGRLEVEFEALGAQRKAVIYSEDATKFIPDEIKNGLAMLIIFAPTVAPREEGGKTPGQLRDVRNLARLYKLVSIGGHIFHSPVRNVRLELTGFSQILQPENQTDEFLFQKNRQEPQLRRIMEFDKAVGQTASLRDGSITYSVNSDTLSNFSKKLELDRRSFERLRPQIKQELLPTLKQMFAPDKVSYRYLNWLTGIGFQADIVDQETALRYFIESKEIVFNHFPELAEF